MPISLSDLDYLASDAGAQLLERLAAEDVSEGAALRLLTALRREVAPSVAGAALEMARLRRRAEARFGPDAARLWFTADALEQASDAAVRAYRARAFSGATVVDACCGIGADSLAMAGAGADVLGLDLDPVRVAMARLNAAALRLPARFAVADVRAGLPPSEVAFFDPGRRDASGRRIHHVERYEPPLATVRGWARARIVVKLSPGVDLAQLAPYGGRVEFVSVEGDLKEATLWLGEESGQEATLLAGGEEYHWRGTRAETPAPLDAPRAWLLEPDPAILRAGLVADMARALGAAQLDATIAYLTAEARPSSPWVRAWRVLDWMPFGVKPLRAYLRERRVGTVTVKKRGSAVTPEALIPQLKLRGDESRTLVLTRLRERPIVLICADYAPPVSTRGADRGSTGRSAARSCAGCRRACGGPCGKPSARDTA